ncbi:MAG: leucine-rich repeat protein [Clostridia bacterium]|nr:leucine-rich repeat protein [Clostridia bacterium]
MNRFFKYTKILLIAILSLSLSLLFVACGEDNCEHEYNSPVITQSATCDTAGSQSKTCKLCDNVIEESIAALGHNYSEWVITTQPACQSEGVNTQTCNRCGHEKTQSIPATGHTIGTNYDDTKHWKECIKCGGQQSDEGYHSMQNSQCTVCGYQEGPALIYELSQDGLYYSITGYEEGAITNGRFVIPAMYNGKPVKEISWLAFGSAPMQEVVISEGIEVIASNTFFGCYSLEKIYLPSTIKKIDGELIGNTYHPVEIHVADLNKFVEIEVGYNPIFGTQIDYKLFANDQLVTSFVVPESMTVVPSVFREYGYLTSVVLHDKVTKIGDRAFKDCKNLKTINLTDSVIEIGASAFERSGLAQITGHQNVKIIGESAFNSCSYMTQFDVPANCESIGANAFAECSALETVTFGFQSKLKSIGNMAFFGCTSIEQLALPDSVTSIGELAFAFAQLTNFVVGKNVTELGWNVLMGCQKVESIKIEKVSNFSFLPYFFNEDNPSLTSFIVDNIDDYAQVGFSNEFAHVFKGGAKLYVGDKQVTQLVLSEGITKIAPYAFSFLEFGDVCIPSSVKTIGEGAFMQQENSTALKKISFAQGSRLETIGVMAFANSNIESIVLPDGLQTIENRAFYGLTQLKQIKIPSSLKTILSEVFDKCAEGIRVDIDSLDDYMNIEINKPEKSLFNNAELYHNGQLVTSVNIDKQTVYPWFSGIKSIVEVTFGQNVKTIGACSFVGCSIENLYIPANVTDVQQNAFADCTKLKIADFADDCNLKSLYGVFAGCTALESVEIPNGTVNIDRITFGCTNLKQLIIPASVISFAEVATGCTSLQSVVFEDGSKVTGLYSNPFKDCINLTHVVLPQNLVEISYGAFEGCSKLERIIIPSSVNSICSNAFRDCTSLSQIILPAGVKTVEYNAFHGCDNLTIYCEATSKPSGWYYDWNSNRPVYWYSETRPVAEDNYWHYVNGVVTKWFNSESSSAPNVSGGNC